MAEDEPLELLLRAIRVNGDPHLYRTMTLEIIDPSGEPIGYLGGAALTVAIGRLQEDVIGRINAQRRRNLEAILALPVEEVPHAVIAAAVVDPLIAALEGPDARLVRFAYQAILEYGCDIPQHLWWTGHLCRVLREKCNGLPGHPSQLVARNINRVIYALVAGLDWVEVPLRRNSDEDGMGVDAGTFANVAQGMVLSLLGGLPTR